MHIIVFFLPIILFHNFKSSHPLFFAHVPIVLALFPLKTFSKSEAVDKRRRVNRDEAEGSYSLEVEPDVRSAVSLRLVSPELAVDTEVTELCHTSNTCTLQILRHRTSISCEL